MPFSEYNYIAPAELPTFIHSMASVTDQALAAKFITDAERIVDAYVGPAPRFYSSLTGQVSSTVASGATAFPASIFGDRRPNYWAKGGAYVELIDGVTGAQIGEARLLVASQTEQVTLASGFDFAVPSGAQFFFHQRSAFPRLRDQDTLGTPRMPHELKMAVAQQVEYGIQFGSEELGLGDPAIADGEAGTVQSRTYGSGYSESRVPNLKQGLAYFIAPRARITLRPLLGAAGKLRG